MNNTLITELVKVLSRAQESLEEIDFHGDPKFAQVEEMNDTISSLIYELISILDDWDGDSDDKP